MRKLRLLVLALILSVSLFLWATPEAVQAHTATESELSEITAQWKTSAHALADVNCSSCHQDKESKTFVAHPDNESCRTCHEAETDTFLLGKHGIRLLEGQSPLTPSKARLAMKPEAHSKQMNCNACHDVHSVDTYQASVDSCMTCHNDEHSLNYKNSKHSQLFLAEGNLERPSNISVTCATCHLPRETPESGSNVLVNHNNTYNLKPRDRMASEVCMNCHGMEYSFNSIFDNDLVKSNFARPPNIHLKSFDMIRVFQEKRSGK